MILVIASGFILLGISMLIWFDYYIEEIHLRDLKKLTDYNKKVLKVLKELKRLEKNNKPQDTLGR